MQATVYAAPATSRSGTAMRSARPTSFGPPATITVATMPIATDHARWEPGPPATREQADAAMTLLTAIQAKFTAYRNRATSPAPRRPSAARAAMIDGTPSRGPSGANPATSADPRRLPAPISTRAVVRLKAGASAAPTCRVVATMLAPAKMRKRSKGDCVRSLGATGPMLAVCIRSARLYHSENSRLTR